MIQVKIDLKKENGTYKTIEELREEAIEYMVDELDCIDEEDGISLGNVIREDKGYDLLYKNDEENINDQLEDWEPWDIIQLDYDSYSDYFIMEYGEPEFTDDIWNNLDTDEIAHEIIVEGKWYDELPYDLKCYVDEYNDSVEKLNDLNPIRIEGNELITKYVNCEADVTDLLQFIDKLVRDEKLWEE